MGKKAKQARFFSLLSAGLFLSLGMVHLALKPKPALSAERLIFSLPVLGDFSISVDSLEVFAKEGKITRDFNFYAKRLDQKTLAQLRQVLQKRFNVSHVTVSRLTKMAMGEALLKRLGQVIQMEGNLNGFYGIRSALILAAADEEEGLTVINVMRNFPRKDVRINTDLIFQLANELTTLLEYRDATVAAIAESAENEASEEPPLDFSQMPDLRQTGASEFVKKTLTFEIGDIRQTKIGLSGSYNLDVDIYLPENTSQPAPLVVISHGFGSYRGNNTLAEHLASHGLAVAVPEHTGSDLEYRAAFLRGEVGTDVSPIEYLSRPSDITHLLDELERLVATDPDWAKRLNLDRVGATGNSFGGTAALAVAGAEINQARLDQECQGNNLILNPSLLLQCRATYLPPANYNLRDPRIKAAIAAHPLTSAIYGPEGMSKIEIPTLIVAGSEDLVTPVVEEQIHPFIWLKTQEKYLTLLVPGTHFTTSLQSDTKGTEAIPEFLLGTNYDLGRPYFYGLSVAFFKAYLGDRSEEYLPYLSSSYAQAISEDGLGVKMIQSLTPGQLESAYGGNPPHPIVPETAVASAPKPEETVLAEIQRTGVLKVAMRRDAIPFGYLDDQRQWTGYCSDLLSSLAQELAKKLNIPTGIEVVKLPSTLENRFELVQNKTVHLECGPNTIRKDAEGVVFSNPFFVTGTQFLVETSKTETVNLNRKLAGVKTGVLRNTTTEQFLRERYPDADPVYFQGSTGTSEAVQAVASGKIDAFANDGILLIGEAVRQDLGKDNYTLVPQQPLTCDFYGTILPEGDSQWQKTINAFISSKQANQAWDEWFTDSFPYVLLDLDYCVNRGGTTP